MQRNYRKMNNDEILWKALEKENKLLVENYTKKMEELEEKYQEEKNQKEEVIEEKNKIQEQLDSILYSRSYQMMQKIKRILGK